jgi:1-acyl-sn-glycerol-3-phosphate acyltransferase
VRRAARTDWGPAWLNWLDGLNRLFCQRYHRLPNVHLRLPPGGPAIVVSNHISGLDPLLLIAAADRPLRFLIAREQYYRFGLTWLFRGVGCIPVDRRGRPERALREAWAALRDGEVVAIFPHGRIHLPTDTPRPMKSGAFRLATRVGCPLVPARIEGVRGAGMVVRAVFYRSRARVKVWPAFEMAPGETEAELAETLGTLIGW